MKKNLLLGLVLVASTPLFAQKETEAKTQTPLVRGSWYKAAPATGTYGIDLAGAQQLVKGRKIAKTPVIAIISSGADIEHEALKNSIWNNPKEKADGIDNDQNGLVDDLHGWNFLGGKDGKFMEKTHRERDFEWLRLKDKYADIIFDGQQYFVYENGVRKTVPPPANVSEYKYYRSLISNASGALGASYDGKNLANIFKEYVTKWDKQIMAKFAGKERSQITADEALGTVYDKTKKNDSLTTVAASFVYLFGATTKGFLKRSNPDYVPTWELLYNNFHDKQVDFSKDSYAKTVKRIGDDGRASIVGDKPYDIKDTKYGNNQLFTPASGVGTMMSGLIAGNEVDGSGFSGILPQAKIMNLVVLASKGDPYPKDMILAMNYAVANGADIITLPQQSSFYSKEQKVWLNEAIRNAEKKGVLVIVSAWEKAEDLNKMTYYPSHANADAGKPYSNFMVVANSDAKGNPSSMADYGTKGLDMFVPSVAVYSAMPGDIYKLASSQGFSSSVAAGAAAFLKAYFPKLTGTQIKQLLMNNVTKMGDKEVEKSVIQGKKIVVDMYLYKQLCASQGILNLKNSVQAALKMK